MRGSEATKQSKMSRARTGTKCFAYALENLSRWRPRELSLDCFVASPRRMSHSPDLAKTAPRLPRRRWNLDGAAAPRRFQQRLDQDLHLQRLSPADCGIVFLVKRIEKIRNEGLMRFMRESHRIGAAAVRLRARFAKNSSVLVEELERFGGEHGGRRLEGEFDAFGKARIGDGRRIERADRAIGEAQRRADHVLGIDLAPRRSRRPCRHAPAPRGY